MRPGVQLPLCGEKTRTGTQILQDTAGLPTGCPQRGCHTQGQRRVMWSAPGPSTPAELKAKAGARAYHLFPLPEEKPQRPSGNRGVMVGKGRRLPLGRLARLHTLGPLPARSSAH